MTDVSENKDQAAPPRSVRAGAAAGLRQITVLGMHRSGTSAMAGALCVAGGWVGGPEQLEPADEHNAAGNFGRLDTSISLDGLLAQLGGTWSSPPLKALDRLALEPHRDQLRTIFDSLSTGLPDGRVPVINDPRLSLFASELPTILGSTEGIVVCVRHPLEVARSLRRAAGIPLSQGLALWEVYNTAICKGLSGRVVRVRAFGQEGQESTSIQEFADIVLSSYPRVLRPQDPGSTSWRPERLHSNADAEDEQQWLSAAQVSLWQALAEAARSPQPTALEFVELSALAAQEFRRVDESAAYVSAFTAEQQAVLELRDEISSLSAALEHTQRVRDEMQVGQARAQADLAELRAAHSRQSEIVRESERRADRLEADVAARSAELGQVRAELDRVAVARSAELDQVRAELDRVIAALGQAEANSALKTAEVERLVGRVAENEAQIATSVVRERRLEIELSTHRDLHASVVSAFSRYEQEDGAPTHERVQHWLDGLQRPAAVPGDVVPAHDHSAALHDALVKVEELRGFFEEAQETWLRANPGRSPLAAEELACWLSQLTEGTSGAEPVVATQHDLARLTAAERELVELRQHRDEVVRDHLSVMESQSWKVGHAMTWPVRVFRRSPRPQPPQEGGE